MEKKLLQKYINFLENLHKKTIPPDDYIFIIDKFYIIITYNNILYKFSSNEYKLINIDTPILYYNYGYKTILQNNIRIYLNNIYNNKYINYFSIFYKNTMKTISYFNNKNINTIHYNKIFNKNFIIYKSILYFINTCLYTKYYNYYYNNYLIIIKYRNINNGYGAHIIYNNIYNIYNNNNIYIIFN